MDTLMEYKERQLDALLPRLLGETPSASHTTLRLSAFVRLYSALYRFVVINNNDSRYGDRRRYVELAEELFRTLLYKSSTNVSLHEHARIASLLYELSSEALPFYDIRRSEQCTAVLAPLLERPEAFSGQDTTLQALLCRCLLFCLYPDTDTDDEWAQLLLDTLHGWISALSADGSWDALPVSVALMRIEVLNRYSYMFLDSGYDSLIRKAYHRYRMEELSPAEGATYLYARTCRYDLCLQGGGCPLDADHADRIASGFLHAARLYGEGSDGWLYSLSLHVAHLCEQLTRCYQHEMLESIA